MVQTGVGPVPLQVPRDWAGTFELLALIEEARPPRLDEAIAGIIPA